MKIEYENKTQLDSKLHIKYTGSKVVLSRSV